MNKLLHHSPLDEYKTQASLLLKAARLKNPAALQRFKDLPKEIKRKHALAVIAAEQGFISWADLKTHCEEAAFAAVFEKSMTSAFLNHWFNNYAEAKQQHKITGGFLLPYKKQFFICEANYLKQIGFDPEDPNWQLIDWDWVKPKNKTAREHLYKKWLKNQEKHHAR
jgi:hypothetical protein